MTRLHNKHSIPFVCCINFLRHSLRKIGCCGRNRLRNMDEKSKIKTDEQIKKENRDHRVGQKTRLDIACHSAWWRQIFNVNKLVIMLFIYLTLPNWTTASTALPVASTKHSSVRRKTSHSNYSLFSLTKNPSNKKERRLFCRVGLFLSMDRNGTISGVLQNNGTQEIFELQSFGTSIVRIKHKVTGLFIAMNSKGKVKGQRKASKDYYFNINQEENGFVSFASYYHKKKKTLFEMFLGIKRGGKVKNGKQTFAGQDSIEFLLLAI